MNEHSRYPTPSISLGDPSSDEEEECEKARLGVQRNILNLHHHNSQLFLQNTNYHSHALTLVLLQHFPFKQVLHPLHQHQTYITDQGVFATTVQTSRRTGMKADRGMNTN